MIHLSNIGLKSVSERERDLRREKIKDQIVEVFGWVLISGGLFIIGKLMFDCLTEVKL